MRRGHAYLVRSASGAHLIGNYATFPAARARSAMRADARNEHRLRLHISRAGPKFRKLRAAPSAMPARPIFHAPDSPPPHTLFHSLVLLLFPPYPPFFFPSHGAFRAGNPRHVYRDIIQIYVRGLYSPPQRRRGIISRFSLSLSLSRSLARSLARIRARARNTEPTTSLGPGRCGERPPGGIWRIIKCREPIEGRERTLIHHAALN